MSARKPRPYPNVQWRDGIAYLVVKIDGQRIRESLHTSNWNEAVERREKRLQELKNKGAARESCGWQTPGAAPRVTPSWDAMREYDLNRARLLSREEVVTSGLGTSWARLRAMFPDAAAISNDSLGIYARAQLGNGYSAQTIRRDLWAAMRGYLWATERDPSLPVFRLTVKLRNSPKGKATGRLIDLNLLSAMVGELKPEPAAALLVLLFTGLRAEEFKRFDMAWLRGGDRTHTFVEVPEHCAKWGKARTIPVPRYVVQLLHELNTQTDFRKAWATAAKAVGIARVCRRDLRKTFASTMAPVDAYGIDLIMGHQQLGSVAHRYQDANDSRLAYIAEQIEHRIPWARKACDSVRMRSIRQ